MNGSYYQNPTFPGASENNAYKQNFNPNANTMTPPGNISYNPDLDMEQSYIENILRLNKGKRIRAYVSYPDSLEWRDKIYTGIIEEAGRDHLIMSEPNTGKWFLIRMIYLNYVEFDEKINYSHSYSEKTF
ncbi:MAG: spore coat protein GerQ [Bacilli bacterium]|nr:spore coat protein GerQ [Bacilli bacterium]